MNYIINLGSLSLFFLFSNPLREVAWKFLSQVAAFNCQIVQIKLNQLLIKN